MSYDEIFYREKYLLMWVSKVVCVSISLYSSLDFNGNCVIHLLSMNNSHEDYMSIFFVFVQQFSSFWWHQEVNMERAWILVAPLRKETLLTLKDNVFIWNSFHLLFKRSLEQSIYPFIWWNIRLRIARE